jgi:tetratricopeptide (TPR) repeat protein
VTAPGTTAGRAALPRDAAVLAALAALAVLLIASVRAKLFEAEKQVKNRSDVYFLPPPEQVVTMSLGYRHAFADVLWAHILVAQGLRLSERRRFDNLLRLYDAVNALDPTFRTPYVMADALITFNVVPQTVGEAAPTDAQTTISFEDVLRAREVLERGARARPDDAEIWLILGQFVSFTAPATYLDDKPELAKQWRRDGVAYLERAAELAGEDSNIAWQAIGGAVILREAGEIEASVRFYERAYAVTDDEQLRADIEARLARLKTRQAKLEGAQQEELDKKLAENEIFRRRTRALGDIMRRDLPFVELNRALVLGPPPRPGACAGPGHEDEPSCATSWDAWSERFDERELRARERE